MLLIVCGQKIPTKLHASQFTPNFFLCKISYAAFEVIFEFHTYLEGIFLNSCGSQWCVEGSLGISGAEKLGLGAKAWFSRRLNQILHHIQSKN